MWKRVQICKVMKISIQDNWTNKIKHHWTNGLSTLQNENLGEYTLA